MRTMLRVRGLSTLAALGVTWLGTGHRDLSAWMPRADQCLFASLKHQQKPGHFGGRQWLALQSRSGTEKLLAHRPMSFPLNSRPGVYALGHNSPSSFGGHSYLTARLAGNLMVDSPRYTRALTDAVDNLGGIKHVLISHRDDVADADKWAERYGAQVWIHRDDADAAPYATDITTGDQRVDDGVTSMHIPGHTKGHVAYHLDNKWLFTATPCSGTTAEKHSTCFQGKPGTRGQLSPTAWTTWLVLRSSRSSRATANGTTQASTCTHHRCLISAQRCGNSANKAGAQLPHTTFDWT